MLLGLLLELRDRRAAGALAEVERVLQRVGDAVRAGADAEEHEAEAEDEREQHERPLGVHAQPLEEQLLLPLRRLLLPRGGYRRGALGLRSIRPRAALAMLRTSRHFSSSAFR